MYSILLVIVIICVASVVPSYTSHRKGVHFLGVGHIALTNVLCPRTCAEVSTILQQYVMDDIYIIGGATYYSPPLGRRVRVHINLQSFEDGAALTVDDSAGVVTVRSNVRMIDAHDQMRQQGSEREILAVSDWLGETAGAVVSTHQHGATQSAWAIDDVVCVGILVAHTGGLVAAMRGTELFGKVVMGCGRAGVVVWVRFRTHPTTLHDFVMEDAPPFTSLDRLVDVDTGDVVAVQYFRHSTIAFVRADPTPPRTGAHPGLLSDGQHAFLSIVSSMDRVEPLVDRAMCLVPWFERSLNTFVNDRLVPIYKVTTYDAMRSVARFTIESRSAYVRTVGRYHTHATMFLPATGTVDAVQKLIQAWIESGRVPSIYLRYVKQSTTVSPNIPFSGCPCFSLTLAHPLGFPTYFGRVAQMMVDDCRRVGIAEPVWHNGKQRPLGI
jgi:hypothetical protein